MAPVEVAIKAVVTQEVSQSPVDSKPVMHHSSSLNVEHDASGAMEQNTVQSAEAKATSDDLVKTAVADSEDMNRPVYGPHLPPMHCSKLPEHLLQFNSNGDVWVHVWPRTSEHLVKKPRSIRNLTQYLPSMKLGSFTGFSKRKNRASASVVPIQDATPSDAQFATGIVPDCPTKHLVMENVPTVSGTPVDIELPVDATGGTVDHGSVVEDC